MTISEALTIAIRFHQAGNLSEAASIYRQILDVEPDQPEALHLSGLIAHHERNYKAAESLIRRSIELRPAQCEAYSDLGSVMKDQGYLREAAALHRQALDLNSDYAIAYHNLGDTLTELDELDEALACYLRAIELRPDLGESHNNLGNLQKKRGDLDQAILCYRHAISLRPGYAAAHNNLGVVLNLQGNLEGAVPCFQRAIELVPGYLEAQLNLGQTLSTLGRDEAAIACFSRCLQFHANHLDALVSLGNVFNKQRKLDDALVYFQRALIIKPDHADALNNLGHLQTLQGFVNEAVATFERALEYSPASQSVQSNLLFTKLFMESTDPYNSLQEHRSWNQRHAQKFVHEFRPHTNPKDPDRRLRVGYVSPDFYLHPVGRFFLPLLAAHDHNAFEIYCYSSVRKPDELTQQCQTQADTWRDVQAMSDRQLADQVRHDQIDILVDLSMHSGGNRLLVFARKPAPVQVTYLAYCGTTGLDAIDYRLTDPYLDPPGEDRPFYSEKSIVLPETYWCYVPLDLARSLKPTVSRASQPICFGTLNNFCKVGPSVLDTWCQILSQVPESTLLLHTHRGRHRGRVDLALRQHGISHDRVRFVEYLTGTEYFECYNQIDVALDPFPYGGGTTTCDALWMGVPVVSLAGQAAVGRGGLSILSNVGHPELVAYDHASYVRIAVQLAGNRERLNQFRRTLRSEMQASPLMDGQRFAHHVEAAYRTMWTQWCHSQPVFP